MDNDDRPIGRVLNRREFLAAMAALGAGTLAACTNIDAGTTPTVAMIPTETVLPTATDLPFITSTSPTNAVTEKPTSTLLSGTETPTQSAIPQCIVRPELTAGPYFIDETLKRSDIRVEPGDGSVVEGVPLYLTINVTQLTSGRCVALGGALVDVWHCDALGLYSGVRDIGGSFDTTNQSFLRGNQVTDRNGNVHFTTIYPGWYPGRAVHIHFKVRTIATGGDMFDFTSQLFFDEAISDQVYAKEPYSSKGLGYPRNADDSIFRNDGDQLLLNLTPEGGGYRATFNLALEFG